MKTKNIQGNKILSISSILPVPGIIKHNDFVFQIYKHLRQICTDDSVVIIKPIKYDLNLRRNLSNKTRLQKLGRIYSRKVDDFQVEIMPFLSSWGFRNIHALLTRSIFYINRKRINSLIRTHEFDIIHAQYLFPDGMLAYMINKKYHIPYFVTTHHERYFFDHFISRKMALKIMNNAQKVLPINHTNYLYFKSLGVSNIEMFPLGFNKTFLRQQKMPGGDPVSIFTAAELIKLKNIDKVLQAMKNLAANCGCKYTIIGTGTEKNSLMKLSEELGISNSVEFIDHIPHDKMADEMYKHDIFIMPSYFETFGRVYFEAMAMGIPVICAKNSGIYGIFREGEEGISVDPFKTGEIANALEFLILHPDERLRIGKNGQNLVMDYTWEKIAQKLHSIYSQA